MEEKNLRPNNELEGTLLVNSAVASNILPDNSNYGADYSARPPPPPAINPEHIIEEGVPLLAFELESTKENFNDPMSFESKEAELSVEKKRMIEESREIQTGSDVGRMNKLAENSTAFRNKRTASVKQHNEIESIKLANQIAKVRIQQGEEATSYELRMDKKEEQVSPKPTETDETSATMKPEEKAQGYEPAEYNIAEYEGYEYKSIYD